MLAKRISTVMPDLIIEETLEVTRIHSAMGFLPALEGIIATRPFRNPHQNISQRRYNTETWTENLFNPTFLPRGLSSVFL